MNITTHFTLKEFTSKPWEKLNKIQQYQIKRISHTLELLRELWGNKRILITSGLRTHMDYLQLLAKGYNPSETSDHFYGFIADKFLPDSVGAGDIVLPDHTEDMYSIFKKTIKDNIFIKERSPLDHHMVVTYKNRCAYIGQFIYEKMGSKEWFHISNHPLSFFSEEFYSNSIKKRWSLLTSFDGGKSYSSVDTESV